MSFEATPGFAEFQTLPAPSDGINAVANLAEMKPTEALYAYNVVMSAQGPTVRPGYQTWCSNLTGTGGVRTIISVRGAGSAGAQDYLFAVTANGIWNCSASSSSPTMVVTFGITTGNAGYCEWDHFTNLNEDVILLVCDEANGYYTFDATENIWTKVTLGFTGQGSSSGTTLTISSTTTGVIQTGGEIYTISGGVLTDTGIHIVSGSGPTYTISGTPAWGAGTNLAIINNSSQIYGVDPASLAAVRVFNNRVWFAQAGTGAAWYLPTAQIYGQAVVFNIGNRFAHGGNLNNMYIFTYGSAFGTYLYLVFIGDAGDVIAYTGSDPSSASAWTQSGQWYVGDLPAGRRSGSNYGGDLNILCAYGVLQLSTLFFQKNPLDPTQYLTYKISPAISSDVANYGSYRGFAFIPWPSLQSLIISEPIIAGKTNKQFCYNMATHAWSVFQTLDWQHAAFWHGNMYVGTSTGTVNVMTGNADAVAINGTGGIAINFGLLGAFAQGKNPGMYKFVDLIRAYFNTTSPVSFKTFVQYDFNLADLMLGSVSYNGVATSGGWDSGIWDSAVWSASSGEVPQVSVQGATGMGTYAAVGVLGATMGETTLVGYGISYRPTKGFL